MAKKIIYICDKCGKSSEDEAFLKAAYEYEICDKCFKKFDDHIKAFFEGFDAKAKIPYKKPEIIEAIPVKEEPKKAAEPKKEEPKKAAEPQKETEPSQRKRIDWDKACALKLAGWGNKAIADELGANLGSINAGLYSHLDSYCAGERFGREEESEEEEE